MSVEHYLLGDAQVTVGMVDTGKDAFSVMGVQVADKPKEAKVHVERLRPPSQGKHGKRKEISKTRPKKPHPPEQR